MPRYYAEKIFKGNPRVVLEFGAEGNRKAQKTKSRMVSTALSRALADRAQDLRWESYLRQLEQNKDDGYNGYKKSLLSETFELEQRNIAAKNSLVSFYRKSNF